MDRRKANDSPKPKKPKKKFRLGIFLLKLIGKLFLTLFTLGVVGLLTLYLFLQIFLTYIDTNVAPGVNVTVDELTMLEASTIYYRNSSTGEWEVLDTLFAPEGNRQVVKYEQLPQHLINAVVAIEDHRFWEHNGVDWEGTAAAFVKTFTTGSTRGGSTITQQFLRNVTHDDDVTVQRKVREIVRALEFEKSHSKEDILTLYLNYVYFGQGCDGIQTAAMKYFGKDVSELTLAESACIIGITNNPSLYDPFLRTEFVQADGSIKTPRDFNKRRQEIILNRMLELGYITEMECNAAKTEFLMFTDTPEYKALHANDEEEVVETNNYYSWFTDAVIEDAIRLIAEAKGCDEKMASTLLYSAGYHIYTTLDMDIQKVVDKVYQDTSNFDYPSASGAQLDSAITIIDPYTGNILAMAGGVGEKTVSRGLNLATALRPCGSAIKPLSVYAPAIENDIISPASVIDDYPMMITEKKTGDSITYSSWPRNSNNKYRGYSTIAYSVQWSLNTVATRVLDMVGTGNAFYFMEENLGFDLHNADNDLAPLAMGGLTYGVSTVDMAAAYAAFANSGIYSEPRTIIQILGNDGKEIIVDNSITESHVAMKESTAYLMNKMLHSVITGGTGTSASFDGMTIAGKTGTTSNNFDRYFVGYTPYYSAAVWVGYSQSNEKINSGTKNPATLVWKMIMEEIHTGLEYKTFPDKPNNIVKVSVCADCGLLSTANCKNEARGDRTHEVEVQESAAPTEECFCHVPIRVCYHVETDEIHLAGPYCPEYSCFDQIWLVGREFMFLPLSEPITNEDGSITDSSIILSTDADFHYTYRVTQATCPYHVWVPEPTPPVEEVPSVPGDDDYQYPEWWPWGEPLDPDIPIPPTDDPGTGENTDPDIPDEPDDPNTPGEGDDPPDDTPPDDDPPGEDEPTIPDEPTEPDEPDEPTIP